MDMYITKYMFVYMQVANPGYPTNWRARWGAGKHTYVRMYDRTHVRMYIHIIRYIHASMQVAIPRYFINKRANRGAEKYVYRYIHAHMYVCTYI